MDDDSDVLMHFGVKGMKWGVRKSELPGVSRSTSREARKDASEFARAKMYFGEGAGTRRKLIKASVESKSAKDPSYKKAFDHHLANQDMGTHGSKARTERKVADTKKSAGRTARGVKNLFMQNGAPVTIGAIGVYMVARNPKVQEAVKRGASTAYSAVKNSDAMKAGLNFVKNRGL